MNAKIPISGHSTASLVVKPLRKQGKDSQQYARPPEIEVAIADLSRLAKEEFVARVQTENSINKVPSECLLYFVRRPPFHADEDVLLSLFSAIRKRIWRAVPVPRRHIEGKPEKAQNSVDLNIRDEVLHKFQVLLCEDRAEYQERLDFFECRFNAAVARLRATARRDICNDAANFVPLAYDSETSEHNPEVEKALSCIMDSVDSHNLDLDYRSKIHAAINSLPLDERRVVELFLEGIPIDSKEKDAVTMAKMLSCCEKTVRNRRDRAFAKLAELLKAENS